MKNLPVRHIDERIIKITSIKYTHRGDQPVIFIEVSKVRGNGESLSSFSMMIDEPIFIDRLFEDDTFYDQAEEV